MNAKQIKAVELLAQADTTYIDIAEEIGCSVDALRKWRKQEVFQAAVTKRCRDLLKESEALLYSAALEQVKKSGSFQHIKILLDRIEKLEEIADGRGGAYDVMFSFKAQEEQLQLGM